MDKQEYKPELRLIFQGNIPVANVLDAQAWYESLKEMVMFQSPKSMLNGQIIKILEPCCQQKKGLAPDEKVS
jgi:hypothetical protein